MFMRNIIISLLYLLILIYPVAFFPQENPQGNSQENSEAPTHSDANQRVMEQRSYSLQLMKRAENHFFHKRYDIALRLFQDVIERDPENFLAYRSAGDILLLQNKLPEARKNFLIARDISPAPQQEYLRLGQLYILQKKSKHAIQALEKAIKLDTKNKLAVSRFYLGVVYYKFIKDRKKARQETIENWLKYLPYAPPPEQIKLEKAIALLRSGAKLPRPPVIPPPIPKNKVAKAPSKPEKSKSLAKSKAGASTSKSTANSGVSNAKSTANSGASTSKSTANSGASTSKSTANSGASKSTSSKDSKQAKQALKKANELTRRAQIILERAEAETVRAEAARAAAQAAARAAARFAKRARRQRYVISSPSRGGRNTSSSKVVYSEPSFFEMLKRKYRQVKKAVKKMVKKAVEGDS